MKKIIIFIFVLVLSIGYSPNYSMANAARGITRENVKAKLDSVNISDVQDSVVSAMKDTLLTVGSEGATDNKGIGGFEFVYDSDENPQYELIIALAAIISPFVTILLVVIACLIVSYKKRKRRYELIEKAIESNYQIPEYVINESKSKSGFGHSKDDSRLSYSKVAMSGIRQGATMMAVGLGLIFAFGFGFMGAICSILLFLGLAKVIVNVLELRRVGKSTENNQPAEEDKDCNDNDNQVPPPFNK